MHQWEVEDGHDCTVNAQDRSMENRGCDMIGLNPCRVRR